MSILFDPKVFNYVIMALYIATSARWAFARSWGDAAYWLCACGITASVTFGFKHAAP